MAFFDYKGSMVGPVSLDVDPATETVEGRIGNLLGTDQRGNYTNAVVKQAQDRQSQAFNARGLLNTNMAQQAAQEAATSKAIDIAAPDAQTMYNNRRGNLDTSVGLYKQKADQDYQLGRDEADRTFTLGRDKTQNEFTTSRDNSQQIFTTRQDYQKAVQTIGQSYQRQLDTINSSSMTPEDKSVAIAQAAQVRDGELAYQNNLYSRMPQWQQEWLAAAVPTNGMDLGAVNNLDTLSNIANDPAQSQAMRDQALARMQALRGGAGTTGGGVDGSGGGAPGTPGSVSTATGGVGGVSNLPSGATGGSSGQPSPHGPYPTMVNGMQVNWDDPIPGVGMSMRQQYEKYLASANASGLRSDLYQSPTQFAIWWEQVYGGRRGGGYSDMIGGSVEGAAQGAADSVSSGSEGGNGIGPGDI